MSKIPKPPSKIEKGKDVQSAAHDELLKWLYENLPTVLHLIVGIKRPNDTENTVTEYLRKLGSVRNSMLEPLKNEDEKTKAIRVAKMKEIADHMQDFHAPAIPTDREFSVQPAITDLELQYELKEESPRSGHPKVVGYADMRLTYFHLYGVYLRSKYLSEITDHDDDLPVIHSSKNGVYTQAKLVQKLLPSSYTAKLTKPFWAAEGEFRSLVVDVRSSITSVGSLLQELKTLHSYCEPDEKVALVVEYIDEVTRQMVESAGFYVFERQKYLEENSLA